MSSVTNLILLSTTYFLRTLNYATYRKCGKGKSVLGPVSICKSFHNIANFLLYDMHFYLVKCFHDQR